jgi:hypothetical protein
MAGFREPGNNLNLGLVGGEQMSARDMYSQLCCAREGGALDVRVAVPGGPDYGLKSH